MKENEKFYSKNSDYIEFDDLEQDDIEQIFDFGVREGHTAEYDEDVPEVMLVQDTSNNIHILKGARYGKAFSKYIEYPIDIEEDGKNNVPIS